jgi:glycosyltransferase involved in cell wall biosynthesis
MAKPLVSVVLPVFNEEENVWLIAERYAAIARKLAIEVIFVEDGGSKDNTRRELIKLARKHPFVRNLFTSERGYGISIANGLRAAKGEYVCWTHADLQCDPNDVFKAYSIISQQPDPKRCYVKGDRKGRPLFDQFFTTGMSIFETLYLRTPLHDINAQPNLFHRSFLKGLPELPRDFSFDLCMLYLAKRRGMRVIRFPVRFAQRLHGASSWNTGLAAKYKFITRTVKFTLALRKRLTAQGL